MEKNVLDRKIAGFKKIVDDHAQLVGAIEEYIHDCIYADIDHEMRYDKDVFIVRTYGYDGCEGDCIDIPIEWLILEGEELEQSKAEYDKAKQDALKAKEAAEEAARLAAKEKAERAEYERLRAKFG